MSNLEIKFVELLVGQSISERPGGQTFTAVTATHRHTHTHTRFALDVSAIMFPNISATFQ